MAAGPKIIKEGIEALASKQAKGLATQAAKIAEKNKELSTKAYWDDVDATLARDIELRNAKVTTGAAPDAEIENIRLKKEQEELAQNEFDLFDTSGSTFNRVQTTDKDQFKRRLHEQLADPDYAAKAVTEKAVAGMELRDVPEDFDLALAIKKGNHQENLFQRQVGRVFRRDKRRMAAALDWLEDSPYVNADGTPRVMVHVEEQTDTVRGSRDFIQFDRPREGGLHSGSNAAAIKAGLRDIDEAMRQFDEFDSFLDDVSEASEYEPEDIRGLVVEALDSHFFKKFSDDPDSVNAASLWDEVQEVLSEAIGEVGGDVGEVTKFIGRAKRLKTANSTPHLFKGKNGLYMKDRGGFTTDAMVKELLDIFPEQEKTILALTNNGTGTVATQKRLQSFIEDQGFDHIVYHNTVEDVGSISIINWNEDLFMPLFDPRLSGGKPASTARAAAAYFLGVLGVSSQMPGDRGEEGTL
jgi:hypothetical protein